MADRPCADCNDPSVTGCQCAFADTDCIDISGSGSVGSPFTADLNLDPDAANIATVTGSGLLVDPDVPAVRVHRSTTFIKASGDIGTMGFTEAIYDTHGMYDPGDQQSLTVVKAGIYHCGCYVAWDANPDGWRYTALFWNNTQGFSATVYNPVPDFTSAASISGDYAFDVGEQAQVRIGQSSGINLGGSADFADFWMHYVRPLP